MRLTTILIVLFSCLVLIVSSTISRRDLHAGSQPLSRTNYLSKSKDHLVAGHERLFQNGRRPFLGRTILESVKEQRRRH